MSETRKVHHQPPESDVRAILKALESSGVLKDIDNLSEAEGKRRVLAEYSRQGLGGIHPDLVVCNSEHYFFVVKSL